MRNQEFHKGVDGLKSLGPSGLDEKLSRYLICKLELYIFRTLMPGIGQLFFDSIPSICLRFDFIISHRDCITGLVRNQSFFVLVINDIYVRIFFSLEKHNMLLRAILSVILI